MEDIPAILGMDFFSCYLFYLTPYSACILYKYAYNSIGSMKPLNFI